ncbi:hypothetical protein JCM25156A_09360 [Komagataeibacter kakiaceti JCM 25156]|uniref:phospholipase D-like domain-containing protein n=1 Tax=Komagataeibacter kakiaceti TaxID=943261 RepID=UPI0004707AF0|nr:phospholipase D-like domain-containing protein [Komagataeibacter kakiaceti]
MLVANTGKTDHSVFIPDIIKNADEIFIAVAFLKRAGADLIAPLLEKRLAMGANVELFIGTDFFLTDPAALESFLALKDRHRACKIRVADRAAATFHPKAYMSRRGNQYRSLIGSANLTGGALSTNEELSLCVDHSVDNPLTTQLIATFDRYRQSPRFQELDSLVLEQYASRHAIDARERKKYEKARDNALPSAFDLRVIENWYRLYRADAKAMSDLRERKQRRVDALRVQTAIAALAGTPLNATTKATFQAHFRDLMTSNGGRHLWGSGDIHRRGSEALDHPKEVIDLFALGRSAATMPARDGYDAMRKAGEPIPGVGLNMATEILCTFAPDHYAVYNGNTVGALNALGITAPTHPNFRAISPPRYEKLCATIHALGRRIGGANFSETDAFLNWIYWKVKDGRGHKESA